MAQVPPPPHADGKNIFLFTNVVRRLDPASTSIDSCPFIMILTMPEGASLAFANKIRPTKNNVKARKTVTQAMIVVLSNDSKTIRKIEVNYISIPINIINAIPISPVIIKVIPKPLKGGGTLE
jgi:hypothetical protein